MTLLNQVNFILSINAFRFIILRPPSQYCLITTFCLIFVGPFHKKSKNILFNSLIVWWAGFGIKINRWFNIGRRSVFITVILPKGVRYRLFQSLIKDLVFWIFSLKLICCICSNSIWKFIPSSLKAVFLHDSFHLVLIDAVLNLLTPIHTAWVFSKLTFRPGNCEYSYNTLSVALSDLLVPSKRNSVSSAYWESLCSLSFIIMPLMFMLFLIIIPKISAQRINRKVDTGSPCRHPRPILKNDDRLPHWFTLNLTLLLNVFIQEIIDLPKPKNSITLYINDQDTESKAFSKSTESSNPGYQIIPLVT